MFRALLGILIAAVSMPLAMKAAADQHVAPSAVANVEDLRWLYDHVRSTGILFKIGNVMEWMTLQFSPQRRPSANQEDPGSYCSDVTVDAPNTPQVLVFDALCTLPYTLSDRTVYVSAKMKLVLVIQDGTIGLGGVAWIREKQGNTFKSVFPDEERMSATIRETVAAIVREEKRRLEQ